MTIPPADLRVSLISPGMAMVLRGCGRERYRLRHPVRLEEKLGDDGESWLHYDEGVEMDTGLDILVRLEKLVIGGSGEQDSHVDCFFPT